MKKYPFYVATILFGLALSGCGSNAVKFYKLTLVVPQDMGLNEGATLSDQWKYLCNYQFPDSCSKTLLVPEITIIRPDFTPAREEKLPLFLSGFNSWRPHWLINAMMIQEDYDVNLSGAKYPAILTVKSGASVAANLLQANYPDAIVNPMEKSGETLRKIVMPQICVGGKSSFTLILTGSVPPPDIIPVKGNPATPTGDSLATALENLIDKKKSPDERSEMIPGIVAKYFSADATIEEIGEGGLRLPVHLAEAYLNTLITSRTIERLEIVDRKLDKNGQYWTVMIKEHHQ